MASHSQTIHINTRAVAATPAAQKIKAQPGQALQLVIDGVAYVGQPQIKGKAVQLVRKGRQLEVQLQDQAVAVVEDFYASEGAAPGQALALSAQDTLALLQEGSAVQVAAAPAAEPAVALPQWGTLVAQANPSTTGNAPAAAAAASAAPEATGMGMGMGTALLGALGLAALASGGGGSKDTTAPTATVTDNTAGTATGAVTYTIAFSEAVKGFDASKVSTNAGTLSGFVASADGKTFTIVLTPPANATGSAQLSISTSGVTDAAGNTAVAPTVAAQAYDTVPPDTMAPTATVTDNTAGTATGAVTYTIAFSEAVKGFDASKVSTNAGTLGDFVASADGKTFTIVLTPPANATGTAQLSISTTGVTDAAGNTAVAPTVAAQVYDTVPPDTTAPTVTVTDNVAGTANGPVTYTIAFSEAVKGFDASKLSLNGGSLGALTQVSDSEYSVVATPAANATGTLQLTVSTSGVTDAAGNVAVAPTVAAQAYDTVPPDTTAPTAAVTDNTAGTATGAVTYTIAFNEAVKGFDASKVSTNAGTLSGFVASADGKTFTIVLTPPANATGTAQLSISTTGVTDAAGNTAVAPTVAAQAYDTVPPDTTAPTVTVTDNAAGTANGAVTYTIAFSEAVKGFDASKITASAGTLSDFVASADGKTYTIVLTPPANATGTAQLSVSTTGVTDAAGNAAVAPTVAAQAYDTVPPDTTAPTVTVTDNTAGTANGPVTFTVKFSEAVTGFDASKLSLSGGSLGALTKVSDSEYTVVATPAANATGTLQLSVSTAGVADAAGNTAVAPAVASQAYAQNVLQGNIVAGPVVGTHSLSVKVFNAAGQAIASASVDPSGNYKVGLGNHTGPVSVLVIDSDNAKPDYVDEVKKQAVDLTANLLAAGNVVNSADVQTININPVTTVAANKAGVQATTDGQAVQATTLSGAELAAKISQSNIAVAKALNIGTTESSLLSTSVVATVTTAGQDNLSNANTYGKVLATLSALDQIKGSTEAAILALVQSISDQGTLSTTIQAQLVQAATVANVPATTVVPGYQPPEPDAPADPVLSMSFAGKTAAETAALLTGLSANQKSLLSVAQGAQIGVDQLDSLTTFAGLSANFVDGLQANVLA
ncbi:beta strand repeat-containing protein, partial [Limnohabitans radicicola]